MRPTKKQKQEYANAVASFWKGVILGGSMALIIVVLYLLGGKH